MFAPNAGRVAVRDIGAGASVCQSVEEMAGLVAGGAWIPTSPLFKTGKPPR